MKRLLALISCVLATSLSPASDAVAVRNIVYEEGFVFQVATRLADRLSLSLNLERLGATREEVDDQKKFFEVLFFNELIACDSPLPALEPDFGRVSLSSDRFERLAEGRKHFIDNEEQILAKFSVWKQKAQDRVLLQFLRNPANFHLPSCVLPQVLAQSQVLRDAVSRPHLPR